MILKQVADTGSLPLSFEKRKQAIRQGRLDYQAGVLEKFKADDALNAMQELARE